MSKEYLREITNTTKDGVSAFGLISFSNPQHKDGDNANIIGILQKRWSRVSLNHLKTYH